MPLHRSNEKPYVVPSGFIDTFESFKGKMSIFEIQTGQGGAPVMDKSPIAQLNIHAEIFPLPQR